MGPLGWGCSVVRYLHAERNVDVLLKQAGSGRTIPRGFYSSLLRPSIMNIHSNTSKMPLVKLFVEEIGVNPHDREGCNGRTALHIACNSSQFETAVYLIENQNMKVRTKISF